MTHLHAEPPIVAICGSTRFMADMAEAARRETAAGRIVVKPDCDLKTPHPLWADPQDAALLKARLGQLHRAKIRLAAEVLVVGDYVGDSTRSEIAYAHALGKPVRFTHCANCEACVEHDECCLTPETHNWGCPCGPRPTPEPFPGPEAAYSSAPSIDSELAWADRAVATAECYAELDRDYYLRQAAVMDRIALLDEAAEPDGDAVQTAVATALTLLDTDRPHVDPNLTERGEKDPRGYVRYLYARNAGCTCDEFGDSSCYLHPDANPEL